MTTPGDRREVITRCREVLHGIVDRAVRLDLIDIDAAAVWKERLVISGRFAGRP